MKKTLLLLILCWCTLQVPAKDLPIEVRGNYSRPVKMNQLRNAVWISDVVSGYASNWIKGTISVEILALNNGRPVKATGKHEKLTADQKIILASADMASNIIINVHYKDENAATGKFNDRTMHVELTVIPEIEAEFKGGEVAMNKYFNEHILAKIDDLTSEYILQGIVLFNVTETGLITNVRLTKSTGNPVTDELLITVIKKMPAWKPAENPKGIKIHQELKFTIGNSGC